MLINFTNHPYEIWTEPQRQAAKVYGEVLDIPFPSIDPGFDNRKLRELVDENAHIIIEKKPDAVIVAGEFNFVFMMVDKLLSEGVKVICTCSKRVTKEVRNPDGTNEKVSVFAFECFREYAYYDER